MTETTSDTPKPVCQETFVRKSNLSAVILSVALTLVGVVAGAVAFSYDQRERISVVNERVDRHTEEIREIRSDTKQQLDRIEQGIIRLSPGRASR